jgi:hypothetical protein
LQRQEDLSADVRLVAFCKFVFIIFATAHWLGCVYYWLASKSDFASDTLNMNWLTAWVEQSWVGYAWNSSSGSFMYIVILFKGFALLTNMGYEGEVCIMSHFHLVGFHLHVMGQSEMFRQQIYLDDLLAVACWLPSTLWKP